MSDIISELVGTPLKLDAIGGAYEGAAQFDEVVSLYSPPLQSADGDILPDKDLLDARSRDILRNDAYVQSGATIHKDSIVGNQYNVSSQPDFDFLGKTTEWADAFQKEAESLFRLFTDSQHNWIDASRQNNFTGLIRLAVGVHSGTGEALAIAEYSTDRKREFKLNIQMVDADRLATPPHLTFNKNIRGGIEKNKSGVDNYYHIRLEHQNDVMLGRYGYQKFKRVAARKPWGRQQVIFMREQKRVDQTRGISDIVAGMKEIAITKKFREVTLQNAVVNATYAATIESEMPNEIVAAQMGMSGKDSITDYATTLLGAIKQYTDDGNRTKIDGAKIPVFFPGTSLKMQPAGKIGGIGQDFEASLLRHLAAALNLSYEELSKDYSKANLSSARLGMINTQKFMKGRKKYTADYFATSIWRLFIEEAVLNNRLKTFPASQAHLLYTNGHLNLMFDALCLCSWIGAGTGAIDPLKERQADLLGLKAGIVTRESIIAKDGGDYRRVFAQREREDKLLKKHNIVLESDNGMNAVTGAANEVDTDE